MQLEKVRRFQGRDAKVSAILMSAVAIGPIKSIGRKGLSQALVEMVLLEDLVNLPRSRSVICRMLGTGKESVSTRWYNTFIELFEGEPKDYFDLARALKVDKHNEATTKRLGLVVKSLEILGQDLARKREFQEKEVA
jgi:hypothetical protein